MEIKIGIVRISNIINISYKKLNIHEIEALISQERVHLKELVSEKKNLDAINSFDSDLYQAIINSNVTYRSSDCFFLCYQKQRIKTIPNKESKIFT